METAFPFETVVVLYLTTRPDIPEDHNLRIRRLQHVNLT